jgi:uncharacterized repeat protein (TIGR03806 family)
LAAALLALLAAGGAPAPAGPSPKAILAAAPPAKLSAYGLFSAPATGEPAAGVVAYRLNAALFSDHAEKRRFVYLPPGAAAAYDPDAAFAFPVGSALVKTFGFKDAGGVFRPIETRLLLRQKSGWRALPYVWYADGTDADLALAGARRMVSAPLPDGRRIDLSWSVPNINQCKGCHALDDAVVPIGIKARHLNGPAPDVSENQLARWTRLSLLAGAPAPQAAPKAPAPDDLAAPLDARARAYLDVNCAHCHNPRGPASNSGLDLSWGQTDAHALGVGKRPVAAGRGSAGFSFSIEPGAPDRSILLHRMESADPGVMMPELGRTVVDEEGVGLIRAWIAAMEPAG